VTDYDGLVAELRHAPISHHDADVVMQRAADAIEELQADISESGFFYEGLRAEAQQLAADRDAARAELAMMTDTASRWNATAKVFERRLDAVIALCDKKFVVPLGQSVGHTILSEILAAASGDTK
jgi:hypothetical protein